GVPAPAEGTGGKQQARHGAGRPEPPGVLGAEYPAGQRGLADRMAPAGRDVVRRGPVLAGGAGAPGDVRDRRDEPPARLPEDGRPVSGTAPDPGSAPRPHAEDRLGGIDAGVRSKGRNAAARSPASGPLGAGFVDRTRDLSIAPAVARGEDD